MVQPLVLKVVQMVDLEEEHLDLLLVQEQEIHLPLVPLKVNQEEHLPLQVVMIMELVVVELVVQEHLARVIRQELVEPVLHLVYQPLL